VSHKYAVLAAFQAHSKRTSTVGPMSMSRRRPCVAPNCTQSNDVIVVSLVRSVAPTASEVITYVCVHGVYSALHASVQSLPAHVATSPTKSAVTCCVPAKQRGTHAGSVALTSRTNNASATNNSAVASVVFVCIAVPFRLPRIYNTHARTHTSGVRK
jgi:hypothetical protein